jgi:transposase, IS30 family
MLALQQYLPKRSNFRLISENDLDSIVEEINNRPRKTLGYKTPNQVFEEEVKLCA